MPSAPPPNDRPRARGTMRIAVTFRHVPPTPALRAYAEEKLGHVRKYLRRPTDAHVILSVSKQRHVAEITLQADHVTMFAQEETHDLYSAIDLALDKLVHQAQKLKAKRRSHKGSAGSRREPRAVAEAPPARGRRAGHPEVVRGDEVFAEPMSLEEAVEQLRRSRDEVLVFRHASDQGLAVLYRRKDGRFGLIEPEGR
jgi:putative sigma-54 modulation protein